MTAIIRILAIGIIVTITACRSTKLIQTAIAKKDSTQIVVNNSSNSKDDSIRFIRELYSGIRKNSIRYETFSAKVKVDFTGADGKKNDFNAFIRLDKDSILWFSINAALGIEAFRVMITPDSVKVLNKLDKIVQLRSVNYLQEIVRLPISFYDLQDLLIGNPVYLDSNIVSYAKNENVISLISIGDLFKHFLSVNNSNYTLQHSKLDDVDVLRARTADITYGKYETRDGNLFSTYRKISFSESSKLDIEMDFKQFNFNEELNFPFSIPRNYKRQ